jgi:DNA ligase (NAD+)
MEKKQLIIKKLSEKIYTLSKSDFEKFLEDTDFKTLEDLKNFYDDLYYNSENSVLEDYKYDLLVEHLKKNKKFKPTVGAKLREGENRVKLPFWLGSLDKITPQEPQVFKRWMAKNKSENYIICEKLDGVACLLEYDNGKIHLYTRGDGEVGANISYLVDYFQGIPNISKKSFFVRGELIMEKDTFENKYRDKVINGKQYKNSRNMVSGLIGGKTAREGLNDIIFMAYEIVEDSAEKPTLQLKKLEKYGFEVVKYGFTDDLNLEGLENILIDFKKDSKFEIDGIVVAADEPYDRNIDSNPSYMFAFKMLFQDAIHQTTVKYVEWGVSKWGQLKPVVVVEPIELNDITISRATAHNAKYVVENNLGPGAIIEITRSKDVIPYIVSIIKQAKKPDMPEQKYVWDKNNVNIFITEEDNTICIKLMSDFFAQLSIKFISFATVSKMYDAGYTNILKILAAKEKDFLEIPEFQEKSAKRIYENIHQGLQNIKLSNLIAASSVLGYGIGYRKIESLLQAIPDLLQVYKNKKIDKVIDMIVEVEGFSYITAEKIANNLKYADQFIKKVNKYVTFAKSERVSDDLNGNKYVMSGFRDKELEKDIISRGGKITTSVSKNTTALIVKSKDSEKTTSKFQKAEELGIPIFEKDYFIKKFL